MTPPHGRRAAGSRVLVVLGPGLLLLAGWLWWAGAGDPGSGSLPVVAPPPADVGAPDGTAGGRAPWPGDALTGEALPVGPRPDAEATEPPEEPSCRLRLRLASADGGPLADARVIHRPFDQRLPAVPEHPVAPDGRWAAQVSLDGAPGAWRLEAFATGHEPATLTLPFLPPTDLDLGTLTLAPARRLAGVVLDSTGLPIPGARVQGRGRRRSVSHTAVRSLSEVIVTGPDGRFAADLAPLPGNYDLRVAAWHADHGGPFEVLVDPEDADDVVIRCGPAASVSGQVTRRDGTPLPGARVFPTVLPRFDLQPIETDGQGRYDLALTEGQRVSLDYGLDGYVRLDTEAFDVTAPAADISLLLVLESRLLLEARDALSGAPIPRARVSLCSDSWGYQRCHEGELLDGFLELGGLPPGTWSRLRLRAPGYHEQLLEPLIVSEGQVVGPLTVRLQLRAADLVVSGRVLDGSGRPVGGAKVSVHRSGDERQDRAASAVAGDDGRFEVAGLTAGPCLIWAEGVDGGRSEPVEAELTEPGWSGLDLVLQPASVVEGRLMLPPGEGTSLPLLRLNPSRPGSPGAPPPAQTTAGGDGTFRLVAAPGRYQLTAWARTAGGLVLEAPRTRLELLPGEQRWLDLTLTLPERAVTGLVLGPRETAGWTVTWTYEQDVQPGDWSQRLVETHQATVDADGRYRLEGVRPGRYAVTLTRADGSPVATLQRLLEPSQEALATVDLPIEADGG